MRPAKQTNLAEESCSPAIPLCPLKTNPSLHLSRLSINIKKATGCVQLGHLSITKAVIILLRLIMETPPGSNDLLFLIF